VSLASPQNPSGAAIPRTVLAEVLSVMPARYPDTLLLLDETYRCAVYGDDVLVSSAATTSPNVVVTGSLSKCHGVPGVRIR
jgi:aspartate/methionine/tyrosine aminotransferase